MNREELASEANGEPDDGQAFGADGMGATASQIPDLISLAGTFSVPLDRRDATWDEVVRIMRSRRHARTVERVEP